MPEILLSGDTGIEPVAFIMEGMSTAPKLWSPIKRKMDLSAREVGLMFKYFKWALLICKLVPAMLSLCKLENRCWIRDIKSGSACSDQLVHLVIYSSH